MPHNKRLSLFILSIVITSLACSLFGGDSTSDSEGEPAASGPVSTPPGEQPVAETPDSGVDLPGGPGGTFPSFPGTEFDDLLNAGDLELVGIQGNADGETTGPVLTMTLTNTTNEAISVDIPCGLVFAPTDGDVQPMMVVQPLSVALAAGETIEAAPFVICVDIAAAAPDTSTSYTIGYIAAEDMLTFAECVCGEDLSLDEMDGLGVQFAAWSIQVQGDFASMIMEEGAAGGEFLQGEDMEALGDMFEEMLAMFADEWLDKCGIVIAPVE